MTNTNLVWGQKNYSFQSTTCVSLNSETILSRYVYNIIQAKFNVVATIVKYFQVGWFE